MTKIKQGRTNQDRTNNGPFLIFSKIFQYFYLKIASQLSCEAMLKILSKNIEKYRIQERTNIGPILIGPFLLNLCHGHTFVLFTFFKANFVIFTANFEILSVKFLIFTAKFKIFTAKLPRNP